MYKNYLTHQFALNFDRMCSLVLAPLEVKEPLIRSSRTMLHHFSESLKCSNPAEEARHLHIALASVCHCKEQLTRAAIDIPELQACYEVLYGRLVRLCLEHFELPLEASAAG